MFVLSFIIVMSKTCCEKFKKTLRHAFSGVVCTNNENIFFPVPSLALWRPVAKYSSENADMKNAMKPHEEIFKSLSSAESSSLENMRCSNSVFSMAAANISAAVFSYK